MMPGPGHQGTVWVLLLCLATPALTYKISTVDTAGVCNETIWLEDGPKSAAILRLTTKDFYDFTPLRCLITFKAPQHRWSGLTGVLEEVDLRQYEDTTGHHLAQNECLDYIKVVSETGLPQERQCGSWSVTGQDRLSHLSFRRALVGYCPKPPATSNSVLRCGLSELTVEVSVGQRDDHYLWRSVRWRPHRGFTFVVTAYRYSYRESECAAGLRSCGTSDRDGLQHHCVHHSLWCDHHINCGQPHNFDEMSCHDEEMLGGLVTVMVGPWVGAALLLLLVLGGVIYWRRARPPAPTQHPPQHELNSYAESYEVSSTLSSAHHMAIQVRVVCNSGHGSQGQRSLPWSAADLPPSYESLFPQGPPSPKLSASTSTATTNSAASFDITTTSLLSLGSNTSTSPAPSAFFSNTTQTSSIVIPISAMCNSLCTSGVSSTSYTTTTAFTTTPIFTNTTASATGSSPSSNTPTFATSPDSSSAPTATITVASLGPSLSTRATISVVPNTAEAAPGAGPSSPEAKTFTRLTTTRSNSSKGPATPVIPFDVGTYDTIRSLAPRPPSPNITPAPRPPSPNVTPAPRPPSPNITPPLVEPEDTEITPDDTPSKPPAVTGLLCPASTGAECEATSCCRTHDPGPRLHARLPATTTYRPIPGTTTPPFNGEVEAITPSRVTEGGVAHTVLEGGVAHRSTLEEAVSSASTSLDTGQAGVNSLIDAEENNRPLIDAQENTLMTLTDASATASCSAHTAGDSSRWRAETACVSASAAARVRTTPATTEGASSEVTSTPAATITASTLDAAAVDVPQLTRQHQPAVDVPQLTWQQKGQ